MSQMIALLGMPPALIQDLQSTLSGHDLKVFGGAEAFKASAMADAEAMAILMCGTQFDAGQTIDVFSWARLYAPHLQCLAVVTGQDIQKLITVKNAVTSMAALQAPWSGDEVHTMVPDLMDRAERIKEQERFLRKPLASGLLNVRQARVTSFYQLLGARAEGLGEGGLLSYMEAAVGAEEGAGTALEANHDLFAFARSEARRTAEIAAHVRSWHDTFASGEGQRSYLDLFTVEGEDLIVRDIEPQLRPLNGPVGSSPSHFECCLLALVTRPRSKATLTRRGAGPWVVCASDAQESGPTLAQLMI